MIINKLQHTKLWVYPMVFWDITIFHVSMQDGKEAEHDLPLKQSDLELGP